MSAAPGESTAIPGFLIRSSAATSDTGGIISQPGYSTSGWLPVSARSTVFAGLLQNNRYPDPFFSTNMRNVSTTDFSVPWWYRADVVLDSQTGLRTYVDFSGVLSKVGAYGFLRIALPLFPDAAAKFQTLLLLIALASILYGSAMAYTATHARLIAGSNWKMPPSAQPAQATGIPPVTMPGQGQATHRPQHWEIRRRRPSRGACSPRPAPGSGRPGTSASSPAS